MRKMIARWGKDINMRELRSLKEEIAQNERCKKECEEYFTEEAVEGKHRCRLCGSDDTKLYFKAYNGYTYYECHHCKGLFLINLPRVKEMYGEKDSCNAPFYIKPDTFETRVKTIFAPKVDFVLELAEKRKMSVNKWVDIGPGGGQMLTYIKRCGIEELGIESDVAQYNFIKSKGLNCINSFVDPEADNPELDKFIGNADVVSMIMVLEHIEKPQLMMDYLKRRMKNGALLVIEVPRHPSVATFANITFRNIIYRHITVPIHLQIFNEETLKILFGKTFAMIGEWGFGEGFSDLVNFPVIESGRNDERIYDMIMQHNNQIQRIFDEAGLSDMMFVIAQKNE